MCAGCSGNGSCLPDFRPAWSQLHRQNAVFDLESNCALTCNYLKFGNRLVTAQKNDDSLILVRALLEIDKFLLKNWMALNE